MKDYEYVSAPLAAITGAISVADLTNIINIIVLVISAINIVLCVFFKIYDRIKDGKLTKEEFNDTIKDVKDAVEDIQQLTNKRNKRKED